MNVDEEALRRIAGQARERLAELLDQPGAADRVAAALDAALARPSGPLAQLALQRALRADPGLERWARSAIRTAESRLRAEPGAAPPARYLTTSLPARARGGRRLALHAAITLDGGPGSVPTRPFPIPPPGVDVLLSVASETLEIESDAVQRVRVLPDADSDTVLFELSAPTPGRHEVRVRAFLAGGGGELSAVVRTVEIDPAGTTDRPRTVTARLDHLAAGPDMVTVQIDRTVSGLVCRLIGTDGPAALAEPIPRALIRDILRDAHQMASGESAFTPPNARRRLADWGTTLWGLLPPPVRSEVTARLKATTVSALTLCTDVSTLPWELLTDPAGDGFLVDRVPLVRQTGTRPLSRSLALIDPVFVLGSNPPIGADREISRLHELLFDSPSALPTTDSAATLAAPVGVPEGIADQRSLISRIDAGDFNLLHLACHQANPEGGQPGGVLMTDGRFEPVSLARAAATGSLARRCPLVFFNACGSVDGGSYDTLMGGWAEQFLRAGAGAFIGSSWAVKSPAARRFALAFYREFAAGVPLGTASMTARGALSSNNADPTRLAYAIYGDPVAVASRP
ncbi:hypothetical protein BJY16_007121 [Actinoplanes octamycinicus]|uniref:CHAT domain-containing protein n=1 Tax=Actinoplanes octamycinicus TaxID=135948 RepID=A0A7W7H4U3_9ACTN|nr:CHAT domain-containing protein [Actinoplanes octamycinicus]MBB4743662.1 hypothetical protein [Actinoplanes octamycinicus]GIE61088.1 hypothetical protein Aoc01nite_64900 [Actinoplanes octamycinicus]